MIADWKRKYNNPNILVGDWDYMNDTPQVVSLDEIGKLLYDSVVEYWYYANIGYDSDEEFIFRFNSTWKKSEFIYRPVVDKMVEHGYASSIKKRNLNILKSGADTTSETISIEEVTEHSGADETEKGVSTTSTQSTTNEGNKLARATPNEKLSVEGSSQTTVADTGSDRVIYGKSVETTHNDSKQNTVQYGGKVANDDTETLVMLTPEVIRQYLSNDILKDFALCFEKLFMEVL